jgi:lambda family phage tail tape measure protein
MADIKITVDSSEIRRATQHTTELDAATTRFGTKLDPLLKKEKAFATAVKQVNDAMRLGVATQKEAITEINRLGKAYGIAQDRIDRTTASMTGIRKNTNRMNATIQNAGYQFGDFAVQVQGGQNVLVAFSQQGAQLAGLLPGVAGAVTGVALVIGSSLARALMDGSTLFRSFSDVVGDAKTALEELRGATSFLSSTLKDDLGKEVEYFADIVLKRKLKGAVEESQAVMDKLIAASNPNKLTLFGKELETSILVSRRAITAINEELVEANDFIKGLNEVDPTNAQSLKDAIAGIGEILEKYVEDLGLSEASQEALVQYGRELELTLRDVLDNQEDNTGELEKQEALLRSIAALERQRLSIGEGLDKAFSRSTLVMESMEEGLSKGVATQIASMKLQIQAERDAMAELYKTEQLAVGTEGFVPTMYPADIEAQFQERMGQLKQLQEQLLRQEEMSRSSTGGGRKRTPLDAQVETYKKFQKNIDDTLVSYRKQANLELKLIGMSKEEAKLTEFIFDLENKLGATRDQLNADQQSQYDAIIAAKKKEIELTKQQKLEEEKLAEAKKKVEAVASTLATETVGALRDIVNGTKTASQAFRDMALNIIQQIMDILIWQPLIESLTNSISGAISGSAGGGGAMGGIIGSIFGFQNGGAFSAGNVIPFSRGGVVGSPTYFGMSGGRTGLMGEAGPEAIMPLKRGPDGKLGVEGSGGVTVHQTFNFSANGDDSVKKIIAEAAPKIAQMTEAKIINSRQRGGQMRRAFS